MPLPSAATGYPALLEFSAVSIFKTCSATSSSSKVAIADINSFGACLKRSSSRKVFNADFLLKLSKARILESWLLISESSCATRIKVMKSSFSAIDRVLLRRRFNILFMLDNAGAKRRDFAAPTSAHG